MQTVLEKTLAARDGELAGWEEMSDSSGVEVGQQGDGHLEAPPRYLLAETKAAEVRVVRNVRDLCQPEERYRAVELHL